MDLFVHNYLSQYYYLSTSDVGNDGIYNLLDDRKHLAPVYGSKILKEIETIFGFDEETSKEKINGWAFLIKPDVDLEFFWKTIECFFPIGMDLVAVQPLPAPRGELMFLDFLGTGDTPDRNGRVYDREVMNEQVR